VLNTLRLFLCSALLLFASVAYADGTFQRTKNHRTLVWNSNPKPGDTPTWSGDRDKEGYATGFGTLTWYTPRQSSSNATNAPSAKLIEFGSYFGNMVRGKFAGSVNVHSKGKTAHATFVDGKRTTKWAGGTAPSRSQVTGQARVEPLKQTTAAEPPSPSAGPSRVTALRKNRRETAGEFSAPAVRRPPDIQRKVEQHPSEPAAVSCANIQLGSQGANVHHE
jgi:hypothetical protein